MALSYPSRSYVGRALAGTLSADLVNGATSFSSGTSIASWLNVKDQSTTFGGKIVVAVEYGTINEEKIGCSFNGTSFTSLERNYNGETNFPYTTTAHPSGSPFVVVWSATEAAEAQDAVAALKPVLTNANSSGTTTTVLVGGSVSAGSARVAAAVDHVHNVNAADIIAAISGGISITTPAGNVTYTKNTQSATYSAVAADVSKIILMTNTGAATVTLPSTGITFGQSITIIRTGAGTVLVNGTGLVSTGTVTTGPLLRAVGSVATAIYTDPGWVVTGDLS
jgi:hypothetical protein